MDPRPDRRSVAAGLAALGAAFGSPVRAQSGFEILAPGTSGGGYDKLARAVAEGLASQNLLPGLRAANLPDADEVAAIGDFASGKRPAAAMLVIGLGSVGALELGSSAIGLGDTRPLASLTTAGLPIVVPDRSPLRSLGDLVGAIRTEPGAVRWGGRPPGSADHQLATLLTRAAGADPAKLVYEPSDSVTVSIKVLKGELTVATGEFSELINQIRGGALRALALSADERRTDVDAPTCREVGLDVALMDWRGIVALKTTDDGLSERIVQSLKQLVQAAGWRQMLDQRLWNDFFRRENDFVGFLQAERDRVAALYSGRR